MVKESVKYNTLNRLPRKLQRKLDKLHSKIEREVGQRFNTFCYKLEQYIPELISVNAKKKYIKYFTNLNFSKLIPYRNKKIKNKCNKSYLPENPHYSPCGLKTSVKWPCYYCRFEYTRFSNGKELLTEEEISNIYKSMEV